ncbi:MAG: hypothetical protein ACRDRT_09255 [Pseudonocardiaceae bacterium]
MTDSKIDDDWLDSLLREPADYIADGGFTARVLAKLPAARRPWYASRNFILLTASALACGAAACIPGMPQYVFGSLYDLFTFKSFSADKLALLVPIALLYWTGLSAVAHER